MRAVVFLVLAFSTLVPVAHAGQLRVSSPYLDVVERYRAGDYQRAIDEVAGFPTSGLDGRARRDLFELPCQVLTGTGDCARARKEKPAEFERVLEVWATSLPAAAALHIEAAVATHKGGKVDASRAHQSLALQLTDRLAEHAFSPTAQARGAGVRKRVWLLGTWLLQLQLAFKELEMLLTRGRQTFPDEALVLLASGAFHEVQARAFVLLDASAGRQGNPAAWRAEERTWRLARAEEAYRQALAADPAQAEGYLRLGRTLALQGRTTDAHVALARVADHTTDVRWRYLALLFRAAVYDEEGAVDAARAEYQAALETWPSSQAARLALSRLAAQASDLAAARAELEALAKAAAAPDGQSADPWWAYDFGQAWRIEQTLDELRTVVSK